jgi:MULE transposase domain
MLSSNGTQATIEYFLKLIKARSPEIAPSIFMTDRDHAQVNAIRAAFPECQRIFYCWWHVLRAIRTHFNTKEFPDLWELIQDWIRTTDDDVFNDGWAQIQGDTDVPKSVAEYIGREWLPHKEMWSAMSRQNRTIFEEGDTNMLLESYVITLLKKYLLY